MQPPTLPNLVWYLHVEGKHEGPLSLQDIRGRVAQGTVTKTTRVWREGWEEWLPASRVAELTDSLPAADAAALPTEQPVTWHLVIDDKPVGPFSTEDIARKISVGEVDRDRWVLKSGWEKWQPITEAAEFMRILSPKIPVGSQREDQKLVNVLAKRKLKWMIGGAVGLLTLIWILAGSNESTPGRQSPQGSSRETANATEQMLQDMNGKPCKVCRGTGRTGKVMGCPDCKDPSDLDSMRKSLGTRTTPSGYVVVCSTCSGSGRVAEPCRACGGSGAFINR